MTNRQQWTLIAGVVMTAVFGVALAIKLRPQLNPVEIGSRAPGFNATDLRANRRATLEDYRGKVVLVNIWATWCPPCRAEMPDLESIYKRFKKDGLIVLAISDEEAGKVKQFVDEYGLSYPILLDSDKSVHKQYTIEGLPRSFVYDRDGKLVAQAIDMRTKKQFLDM